MTSPLDKDPIAGASPGGPGGTDRPSHLAYVAHEIRNPLSTALWTAELLARLSEPERGGPRGEKLAGICLRSVGRVRLLVEDHLLCERLDAGAYPLRLEQVLLEEVLATLQSRWPAGAGPLEVTLAGGLAALADRALLERALDAVLASAGSGEGPVSVRAEARGGQLQIQVEGAAVGTLEDPGRGAPSDQRGRSLALAMARRVAAALGGSLTAAGRAYLLAIPAA